MNNVFVEIVKYGDKDAPEIIVTRMGPMSESKADRVESGANINLNHEQYFVRIVES